MSTFSCIFCSSLRSKFHRELASIVKIVYERSFGNCRVKSASLAQLHLKRIQEIGRDIGANLSPWDTRKLRQAIRGWLRKRGSCRRHGNAEPLATANIWIIRSFASELTTPCAYTRIMAATYCAVHRSPSSFRARFRVPWKWTCFWTRIVPLRCFFPKALRWSCA